ncbi:hypothetical protein PsYK624_120070 [Phanerochaete sordida]|uniref:Uncharacterized protein n=1 Tax=Phanerochaete sordida TaxID=48140 RepID=A0A9P3LJ35_9APHY|nr:hypothetical protein PsYK624_120070 [Phanerochaete sordida]
MDWESHRLVSSLALPLAYRIHTSWPRPRFSALFQRRLLARHRRNFDMLEPTFGTKETALPRAPVACDPRGRGWPGSDQQHGLWFQTPLILAPLAGSMLPDLHTTCQHIAKPTCSRGDTPPRRYVPLAAPRQITTISWQHNT